MLLKISKIVLTVFFFFSGLFFYPHTLFAQLNQPNYNIEAGTILYGGSNVPFLLTANQQGRFSTGKNTGFIQAGIFASPDTGKKFDYGYGIEFFGSNDGAYNGWLQQGYAKLKIYFVHISAGLMEETYGNQDCSLSTGSVIWSGNARPLPEIKAGTNGYINFPFTRGYVEFKGMISQGWFKDDRYVSHVMLHHKNLYVRLGGKLPVNISYGLEHFAQWGGISPDPRYGELPHDFDAFKRVFMGKSGNPEDSPEAEVINRLGNHLGSRVLGIDVKLKKYLTGLYYQTIFEDGSGRSQVFNPDGLWGVYLKSKDKSKPVTNVLYEFLHTSYQSGPVHDIGGSVVLKGNDNYFDNFIYRSGWTYHKYTIGTPMITSPVYNTDSSYMVENNRVIAHHVGIEGNLTEKIRYKTMFTYSINMGRYSKPYDPFRNQASALINISFPVKLMFPFKVSATLAADKGTMYGDNIGVFLSLLKTGELFKR